VYIAETPLFELITNKGIFFAYSVDEKDKMIREFPSKGIVVKKVNRSKGLGENDPDMMWETTMNPATRRLVKLDIDPREQIVRDVSNMLFGLDPHKERKEFIFDMLGKGLQELVDTMEGLALEDDSLIY
jgi:DNA gyrase subunit B